MHNRILCLLLSAISLMALCTFPKQAIANGTEQTFQPCYSDTLIYQNAPNTNYGTLNVLELYDYGTASVRNILNFNMTAIPNNAIIQTATLSIYYKKLQSGDNPSGKQVGVYRLTQTAWTETGSTWNKYDGVNTWTTAGGDYTTALANVTTHPAIDNWMVFNVTDQVQYAVNYTSAIAYFLFKFITEGKSSGYSLPEYWSREYTTDTTLRPKLYVNYTLPQIGWKRISKFFTDFNIKKWFKPDVFFADLHVKEWISVVTAYSNLSIKALQYINTFFMNLTLKTWQYTQRYFIDLAVKAWQHLITLMVKQTISAIGDNKLLILILLIFVIFIVLIALKGKRKHKH